MEMSNRAKIIFRTFIALFITALGTTLLLAYQAPVDSIDILMKSLGMALAVAGTVATVREIAFGALPDTSSIEEFKQLFDESNQRINTLSSRFEGAGMTMLAIQRQDFSLYHEWVVETSPQDMFFAGHSVLHRVEIDFKQRNLGNVELSIKRKLQEGSHIKILFLDPTWEYIDKIANNEGEDPLKLRSNLAITVEICNKIWQEIKDLDLPGAIEIRTCREFEQYAFHHISYRNKDNSYMLIGFYFADSDGGMNTPLFSVDNLTIRKEFSSHFAAIFRRSKKNGVRQLLQYCEHGVPRNFDLEFYKECLKNTKTEN